MASTEESRIQGSQQNPEEGLLKLRYEYAWNWFEYHATQRVTMFNYFLIITGILANAYVGLLKEGLLGIAVGLGGLGSLTSIGFFLLDWRNKQLVDMGEDVLEKLEQDDLFTTNFKTRKNGADVQLGFLFREAVERPKWQEHPVRWLKTNLVTHKILIRTIEMAVAACFVLATILPAAFPDTVQTRTSADIIRLQDQVSKLDTLVRPIRLAPLEEGK